MFEVDTFSNLNPLRASLANLLPWEMYISLDPQKTINIGPALASQTVDQH